LSIEFFNLNLNLIFFTKFSYKLFISYTLLSPQLKITMNNGKIVTSLLT